MYKLKIMPFSSVNAITDIDDGTIAVSQYLVTKTDPQYICDVILDEFAHIISGSSKHGDEWRNACCDLAGKIPQHNSIMDSQYRRYGIPEGVGWNIGNITGIQQILTDYHLLQSYRRFSQRILGNEGHWEVLGDNKIRLYPTPKGSFPVVCLYIPYITTWRTPANKLLAMDMLLAESMIMLGNSRGKFGNIPSPDGGTMSLDGNDLRQKGYEMRDKVMADAMLLSDDPHAGAIYRY